MNAHVTRGTTVLPALTVPNLGDLFPFSLSHHIGKSPFSISTYMEEVLQQIDFPPFYMEREM